MTPKTVAVVGATGAVGTEMIRVLECRRFPVRKLVALASARSVGKKVRFCGEDVPVNELKQDSFKGVEIALFSAGSARSKEYAPAAVASGAVVVDNSSAFRMDPEVPLVVPEVNPEAIKRHKGLIANPNCTTIIMNVPVWPLHKAARVRRIIVSSYQAVSGAGAKAMVELRRQLVELLARPEYSEQALLEGMGVRTDTPHVARNLTCEVFPHQIAFNLFPHIGNFYPEGDLEEERKLVKETHKIFGDSSIRIFGTTVRVPVFRAHSESVYLELERSLSPEEARAILAKSPGVEVVDNPSEKRYPMPIYATGRAEVLVGRIRQDPSTPNALAMFVSGDQLLKGAALNAVQIAELL